MVRIVSCECIWGKKSALTEHCLNTGYVALFQATEVPSEVFGYRTWAEINYRSTGDPFRFRYSKPGWRVAAKS